MCKQRTVVGMVFAVLVGVGGGCAHSPMRDYHAIRSRVAEPTEAASTDAPIERVESSPESELGEFEWRDRPAT